MKVLKKSKIFLALALIVIACCSLLLVGCKPNDKRTKVSVDTSGEYSSIEKTEMVEVVNGANFLQNFNKGIQFDYEQYNKSDREYIDETLEQYASTFYGKVLYEQGTPSAFAVEGSTKYNLKDKFDVSVKLQKNYGYYLTSGILYNNLPEIKCYEPYSEQNPLKFDYFRIIEIGEIINSIEQQEGLVYSKAVVGNVTKYKCTPAETNETEIKELYLVVENGTLTGFYIKEVQTDADSGEITKKTEQVVVAYNGSITYPKLENYILYITSSY